jgi:hypothetical protein
VRVRQKAGERGSLKWIQRAINHRPTTLNPHLLACIPAASTLDWLSPLEDDEHSEYRDRCFLERIGHPELSDALRAFWPSRGPQWDALARTDKNEVILVEAKAHLDEIASEGMKAGPASAARIEAGLASVAADLGARPMLSWTGPFYQTANRLAHLHFLAAHGVPARLVFVCFVGDSDMKGPESADEWRGALHMVWRMLGLPKKHRLSDRVIEVFPAISELM